MQNPISSSSFVSEEDGALYRFINFYLLLQIYVGAYLSKILLFLLFYGLTKNEAELLKDCPRV